MAICSSGAGEDGIRDNEFFRPLDLLLLGVWFGLATGLLEVSGNLIWIKVLGRITYDTLRMNWHYVWLTPLSDLVLFVIPALLVAFASIWIRPLRRGRAAVFLFGFMAAWSFVLSVSGLEKFARLVFALGAASVLVRSVAGRERGLLRFARWTTPVGLAMVLALMAGSLANSARGGRSGAPTTADGEAPPNVLLIVLDTVRADAMTPYGSPRDTTPNLARFAAKGAVFEEARSTAPWTLPSHASLFTGRWPFEMSADVGRPLDATFPTLAERLAERGYATGGFVANLENCNAWYGLSRGFQHYEDYYENTVVSPLEMLRCSRLGRFAATSKLGWSLIKMVATPESYRYRKSAAMINRDAMAWLSNQGDRPYFLFLNYFDVHDPYVPPAGAERKFSARGPEEAVSAEDRIRDAYDDCLAYLDDQVGRLLDELERQDKLRNTVVVITSDHGEAFGEHGLSGHGVSLYRPETHIPLIVVHPSSVPAGRRIAHPVSLRDVPSTVLELVGVGGESPFPGPSLSSLWNEEPKNADAPKPVLVEVDRADRVPPEAEDAPARLGRMRSVVAEGRAYILNGDGREELYDLHSDPEEANDLAGSPEAEDELEQFRAKLKRLTRLEPRPDESPLEDARVLR